MLAPTVQETAIATMQVVDHDDFNDLDTPTNAHDCANDELEAARYADGVDISDARYL